jgi:hypothetical protein
MKSFQANWEDEENNRRVELVVSHQPDLTPTVIPTRVTFLCPSTKAPLRSIGVWTEGGRRVLARQVEAAGRLATLPQEIAADKLVEIKHNVPKQVEQSARVLQA